VTARPAAPSARRAERDDSRRGEAAAGSRFRVQPPAYTPIPLGAFPAAVLAAARVVRDPRAELAAELCVEYSARDAVLCGSGTEALRLAIEAVARANGAHRVALPAFSCYDVAAAAVGAGVEIALYDLDPDTLGPEPESFAAALAAGAGAAVVAPLFGLPVDWPGLAAIARSHDATLIEDAAQGFGARFEGRPLGSFGAVSVLSFGRGKGWTGGAGGALLLRDDQVPATAAAPALADARAIAASAVQAAVGGPRMYWLPLAIPGLRLGETVYHDAPPARAMPRAAAAALRRARGAAIREAVARRAAAAAYRAALDGKSQVCMPAVIAGGEPGWLRFPVRIGGGLRSLDVTRAVRLGAAPVYPMPLAGLAQLRGRVVGRTEWPGAATLVREMFTLPTHSRLEPAERHELVRIVLRGDG
jgi:perosamine synthetase